MALAVLALGFSACTEQVEYTPANVPTNDQVYFSKNNGAQVDIALDAESFEILVSRIATGKNALVPVTVTADSLAQAWFEFPEFVEFADSMQTAVYTVAVKDSVEFEYDKFAAVSLTLAPEYTTPYGDATYSFKAGVPAPWSEWEEMSGVYNFALYVSGSYPIPVLYREHMLDETRAQFLLGTTAIGTLSNITIEYNKATGMCQVPAGQAFLTHSSYGPVFVTDLVNYPFVIKDDDGNPIEMTYEDYPCTYDAETGLFTLNLIYYVDASLGSAASGYFTYGVETVQLDGFTQYDYSITMNHVGNFVDNAGINNAVISVAKGADVSQYLMTVISADEDANSAIQGMLAGTVPCDTLTESGYYAYPIAASGNYTALAISFDAEKKPVDAFSTDFEFWVAGDSNPWESLGYAMYTDDIMAGFLKEPANYSYRVEVLANKEIPGLYRVMNPAAFFGADTSKDYYIEIDATDPEGVWIEGLFEIGLDLGAGAMSVTSNAWYEVVTSEDGATKEDAKVAGLCGIFADNVITFPNMGLVIAMGGKPYDYGNKNGAFKLDLADITATPDEESNAPAARMFNAEIKSSKPSFGGFKKIDNSFLTLKDCEIE